MANAKKLCRRYATPPIVCFLGVGGLVLALTGSWSYALGTLRGPFAGAVARDWQSCCADSSWSIAPFAISSLMIGLAVQVLFHPKARVLAIGRAVVWWLSSLAWFFAALLSYGHALE